LQQKTTVENAESSYYRLLESQKRLELEAEAGMASKSEVDEAMQRTLSAENNWVQAQERYERVLDAFKVSLTLPTDTEVELDPNELENLETVVTRQVDYTPETAIEAALNWRLDFATSADRVEDAERKVVLAADNLGAELNLIGSAGVGSTPSTQIDRLQFHEGTYTLGLEADLPLDRKSERNAYREALISLEQQQRNFEDDRDNIELEVRDALRGLNAEAEGYRIQKMALELAEDRLEAQKMLFDIGQSDVRLLLESEDDLLAAQNEVISSLVEFMISGMSFYRDIGVLQVKPDGMWEEQLQ